MLAEQVVFRDFVQESDLENIEQLLISTTFFHREEITIAIELLSESMQKGRSSGYFFLFADIEQLPAGYACFGPVPGARGSWDLYWIALHNHFRGKGLGGLILEKALGSMKNSGARQVYAETSSRALYHSTHRFYEKNSFMLAAQLKDFYNLDDDKMIYVRVL